MAKLPTIIEVSPFNYAVDINIATSIRAAFDIDLDSRYINDYVYLLDDTGTKVEGRTAYRKKVITFTPTVPLQKGMTYQFVLVGDSNVEDNVNSGLRSIIGDCMAGSQTIRFTTEADDTLPAPIVKIPTHNSVVRSKPVFEWIPVDKANGYEVEVAQTNTFNTKLYPVDDETIILENTLDPDIAFEDGLYYWRIRTIQPDGAKGLWSKTMHFNLTTETEGKVSEDDEDPIDPTDDPSFYDSIELELIEVFPKELVMQVPTNVKTLYFRLLGDIDMTQIDMYSLTLTGSHISEDFEEETHGEVKGSTTILESSDGTVYLLFTPEPLVPEVEIPGEVGGV